MTPAAIYRRHRDAIVREQPGQRIDPSRVDARVAVRMAVTGHSYDQIADAIKAGASGDRPGEKRDWEQYALAGGEPRVQSARNGDAGATRRRT